MICVYNGQSSQLAAVPPGTVPPGTVVPRDVVFRFFNYAEQNGYLKILIGCHCEKISVGRHFITLHFYAHLKRALQL